MEPSNELMFGWEVVFRKGGEASGVVCLAPKTDVVSRSIDFSCLSLVAVRCWGFW